MSHILSAWVYIVDSEQTDLAIENSFSLLSGFIQKIIDGHYHGPSVQLDSIEFHDHTLPPIRTNIRGISLWDGKKQIFSRWDVEENVRWEKWRVGVLYELDGELLTLDLASIKSVTKEKIYHLVQPMDMVWTFQIPLNKNMDWGFPMQVVPQSELTMQIH